VVFSKNSKLAKHDLYMFTVLVNDHVCFATICWKDGTSYHDL